MTQFQFLNFFTLVCKCADVFMLGGERGIDITQLGVDQRKVNMLARELAPGFGKKTPIVISHHMLMGLKGIAQKMSKSYPDNAIFIEDEKADIIKKVNQVEWNEKPSESPIYEYFKYIVLPITKSVQIGDKKYETIESIVQDFFNKPLEESQVNLLKSVLADLVDSLIQPVRDHFKLPENQKLLQDVIEYRKI